MIEGKPDQVRKCPPAFSVVLGKLVQRIKKGKNVDMAELLKNNEVVERRRLAAGHSWLSGRSVAERCWLQCISVCAAVVSAKYPHKAWHGRYGPIWP